MKKFSTLPAKWGWAKKAEGNGCAGLPPDSKKQHLVTTTMCIYVTLLTLQCTFTHHWGRWWYFIEEETKIQAQSLSYHITFSFHNTVILSKTNLFKFTQLPFPRFQNCRKEDDTSKEHTSEKKLGKNNFQGGKVQTTDWVSFSIKQMRKDENSWTTKARCWKKWKIRHLW